MNDTCDVLIIGGGLMGCTVAWELARAGLKTRVLERSVPGAEASSAAGGIVGAQVEAHGRGPMFDLCLASRERYPRFAQALYEQTGIDVGFREGGILRLAFERLSAAKLAVESMWQRRAGHEITRLGSRAARHLEPELTRQVAGGVHFKGDARVDPPLVLKAVHIAASRAGAEFRSGAYVRSVLVSNGRAEGVELEGNQQLRAGLVVVAAGSWTNLVGGVPLNAGAVKPARGQIVELRTSVPLLSRVVFGPRCYIVPRDDGRHLVGSTLEFVGYDRRVTAAAIRDLLDAAIELVPALAGAQLGSCWSNFRPYTDDELPILGESGVERLLLATGHYRTGILLAPITGACIAALAQGRPPPVDLSAFRPQR